MRRKQTQTVAEKFLRKVEKISGEICEIDWDRGVLRLIFNDRSIAAFRLDTPVMPTSQVAEAVEASIERAKQQ